MSLLRRMTILAVVSAACLMLTGCSGEPVPDLTGARSWFAAPALERAGFMLGDVRYDEDAPQPAGTVVRQDPAPGRRLRVGGQVDITVAGPALTRVPRLVGLDVAEAELVLEDADLRRGPVVEVYHEFFAAGTVIEQDQPIGHVVPLDTRVEYTVSLGPETVAMPGVTGRDAAAAMTFLRDLGLRVERRFEESPRPEGEVLRQVPDVRQRIETDGLVTLVVSRGPRIGAVPDVTGLSPEEAERELERHGFAVAYTGAAGALVTTPGGVVGTQDPAPGVRVPTGLAIVLAVAR